MSGVVDEGSSKPASASPTGLVVVGDLIGEGSVQEQSVVGETPNLAAGLQALAAPDAVVIAGQPRSSERLPLTRPAGGTESSQTPRWREGFEPSVPRLGSAQFVARGRVASEPGLGRSRPNQPRIGFRWERSGPHPFRESGARSRRKGLRKANCVGIGGRWIRTIGSVAREAGLLWCSIPIDKRCVG